MTPTDPIRRDDPPDPGQTREVFEVLGDELCWLAVRALLRRGPLTQAALASELAASRPTVSRVLARLRLARLIVSSGGRDARHQIVMRDAILGAIAAGDRLAEEVNVRRTGGQRQASRQTSRDRLDAIDGSGHGDEPPAGRVPATLPLVAADAVRERPPVGGLIEPSV